MKIKPIGNRILIKLDKKEQKTTSGIILSSTTSKIENTGVVLEVGTIKEDIKVGDKVIFNLYSEIKVNHNNKDFYILNVEDVLAVIN